MALEKKLRVLYLDSQAAGNCHAGHSLRTRHLKAPRTHIDTLPPIRPRINNVISCGPSIQTHECVGPFLFRLPQQDLQCWWDAAVEGQCYLSKHNEARTQAGLDECQPGSRHTVCTTVRSCPTQIPEECSNSASFSSCLREKLVWGLLGWPG